MRDVNTTCYYRNSNKILIRGIIKTINFFRLAKVQNVCYFTSLSPCIFLAWLLGVSTLSPLHLVHVLFTTK